MTSRKAASPKAQAVSIEQQIDAAKLLHQIGRFGDAERMYEAVLRQDAGNAEANGLLAVVVYRRGDQKLAKKLWRRALSGRSPAWIFLRNLHAYLQALSRDGNPDQAAVLAGYAIPDWPMARLPDPAERQMLREAADMLVALGQPDVAARLVGSVLMNDPKDVRLLLALGKNQLERGAVDLAWQTLSQVDAIIAPAFDLSLLLALHSCAVRRGDRVAAEGLEARLAAAAPVWIAERRPTQTLEVLVLNGRPHADSSTEETDRLHWSGNYPTQLSWLFEDRIHFSSILEETEAGRAARGQLPKPDLVINNHTNGEVVQAGGHLAELCEFADGFGVPVINHPSRVVLTARDGTAALVAGLPGVVVPKTRRFAGAGMTRDDLVREIEAEYDYPVITRTLWAQEGKGMTKVDGREALLEALASKSPEGFFVTQFVDTREPGGFFRKIRAAIVGDEIIVVRVDSDTHWNIHGRKSEERAAFYLSHPELLAEEARICADPDAELGPQVMQALRAIRGRMPLDVFGIDFNVNPAGEVVFFEANATMNLFSTARPEVDYPQEAQERLKEAFRRYFVSLVPGCPA